MWKIELQFPVILKSLFLSVDLGHISQRVYELITEVLEII